MSQRCALMLQVAALLVIGAAGGPALAQNEQVPIRLTIHPMPEPKPALKYRLLPEFMDQIPGNAAVYYGKVTAERTRFFGDQALAELFAIWPNSPLEELRRTDLHPQVKLPLRGVEDFLRRAALCADCDWQLPIRDGPGYELLLPEVQQTRYFGRILAVNARFRVATGQFDEAVDTLQSGYALARNVAKGETIVNGLVGIAICKLLNDQVIAFVQQPEAPNLYWALTMLPQPMIDIRDGVEFEYHGVLQTFPELRDLTTASRSPDEWRTILHDIAVRHHRLASRADSDPPATADEIDDACKQGFDDAKRALVAGGLPRAQVEEMAVHQVALLRTLQSHHDLVADGIKYYSLPFPRSVQGIDAAIENATVATATHREVVPLSATILPAIRTARIAVVRNDREFAVLRVIEALRIYSAAHDGELPNNLSDVTEVPIPDDPVTGKSFDYERLGDIAWLTGPPLLPPSTNSRTGESKSNAPLRYEITIARP